MSISFNVKDDNMETIRNETKFSNLLTKFEYRIYGLQNDDNPPIKISAQDSLVTSEQEKAITTFLKNSNIQVEFEDCNSNDKKIYIGIRRDIRDHIILSASLIQTIIYFFEGRLELPSDYKISGIPSFAYNEKK
jgi:hypothetical protein